MRMVESGGARKWPSFKDAAIFGSTLNHMTAENLGMLVKEHRLCKDQMDSVMSVIF